MKEIKIITSWDDGHQLDLQLGDLLLKYNIPAVFYVAPEYSQLLGTQVRMLANSGPEGCLTCKDKGGLFEIGAHTLTHPQDLKLLSDNEATKEIAGSKTSLEQTIGKPVTKFCYPRGRFDARIKVVVKSCGLIEARTTKVMNTSFPEDPFETDPSIHIYPDRKEYKGLSWHEMADILFNNVLDNGGRFEIWGHSWEIEKYNMWEFLEDFLCYMDDKMEEINYPRKVNELLSIK